MTKRTLIRRPRHAARTAAEPPPSTRESAVSGIFVAELERPREPRLPASMPALPPTSLSVPGNFLG